MTKILSDEDKKKMYKALHITPEEAIRQLNKEYKAMLRGERLEPEFKQWPPNQPLEPTDTGSSA